MPVHSLLFPGPIIQINSEEIHTNDPEFYEQLYVGCSKRKANKWYWAVRAMRSLYQREVG